MVKKMPLNIDFFQILLHVFNFLILAGGLVFFLFKPVNKFLEERQSYFENAELEIKKRNEESQRLKSEYETKLSEAKKQITEMRDNAEKEIAEASSASIKQAQEKADAIILSAEKDAEERKIQILDSVQTEISELVISATAKLLNDTTTPEQNSELYDEFIRLNNESTEVHK